MALSADIAAGRSGTRHLGAAIFALGLLGVAILVLVLYSGTILQFQLLGIETRADAPPGETRLVMLATYLPIMGMMLMHYREIPAAVLLLKGLALFVAILIASTLWSMDPGASIRASVALSVTTVFGAVLYLHYGIGTVVKIIFFTLLGLILLSDVLAVVAPSIAIHPVPHLGDWRGYFTHKNVAGQITTWMLPVTLYLAVSRRIPLWLAGFAILVTLAFITMTHSKTALAVAILILGLAGVAWLLRSDIRLSGAVILSAGGVLALVAILLVFDPDTLVGLFGKDATFTGRTYIWSELAYLIGQKPLLGHGFSAIWDVTYGPLYRFIEDWQIGSGHNSYMDMLVDVGILGTAVFITLILELLRKSVLLIRYGDWALGLLGFLTFFTLSLLSFSETILPRAHSLHWVIITIVFMAVEKDYRTMRLSGASQP
jgi:O-antigen ligase